MGDRLGLDNFPWSVPGHRVSATPRAAPVPRTCPHASCPQCASRGGSPTHPPARYRGGAAETTRPASTATHVTSASGLLRCRQELRQDRGGLFPIARFFCQLLAPRACQLVILRAAVVVGNAPLGGNVAFLFEFQQRWIQRAVIHRKNVAADLFDAPGNPVPV